MAFDYLTSRQMGQNDAVIRLVCLLATFAEAFDKLLFTVCVVNRELKPR